MKRLDAALMAAIAALPEQSPAELRATWRRLFRTTPSAHLGPDLLCRAIAHRLQETALGGLPAAVRRRLLAAAGPTGEGAGEGASRTSAPRMSLKPGATLIRRWRGETHTVLVLEDGFDYRGQRFPSLTVLARHITGAHWSGPRFFGLTARRASEVGNGP